MKVRYISMLLALAGLVVLSSCEATLLIMTGEKPQIELVDGKAHVNGLLGKMFYKKLVEFMGENPNVKTLVLEQVPGSANDDWNVKSCALVHEKQMTTELLANSEIASGGVDLFISGTSRKVANGAKIGVHSWSDGKRDGIEYPKDSPEHQIFLDMFNAIEFDTAFYWFTLRAAPAKEIHWMTEGEIKRYQLSTL